MFLGRARLENLGYGRALSSLRRRPIAGRAHPQSDPMTTHDDLVAFDVADPPDVDEAPPPCTATVHVWSALFAFGDTCLCGQFIYSKVQTDGCGFRSATRDDRPRPRAVGGRDPASIGIGDLSGTRAPRLVAARPRLRVGMARVRPADRPRHDRRRQTAARFPRRSSPASAAATTASAICWSTSRASDATPNRRSIIGQQERFKLKDRRGRVAIVGKVDARLAVGRLHAPVEVKALVAHSPIGSRRSRTSSGIRGRGRAGINCCRISTARR